MEMGFSQLSEGLLLTAKEIHKTKKGLIKRFRAEAQVEIERIEKDIRRLRKERKPFGEGSNSKLEELKVWREHLVQYMKDTKSQSS